MTDDDLLGPAPTRPRLSAMDMARELQKPVSVTLLCEVFGMTRETVKKRLTPLEPIAFARGETPLYNFRQAAQYLVKPKVDVEAYIRRMGSADLPTALQKDVWDAKLKQQKWELEAGELWRTDDVIAVLGETFSRLKTAAQLWIDGLSDEHELSPELRTALAERVDALMVDMHERLVVLPKDRATRSQLANLGEPNE